MEQITTSIATTSTVTLIHTHTAGMAGEACYGVLQDWSAWKGPRLLLRDPPHLHPRRARGRTPRPATTTTLPPHSPLLAPKWAKSPRVALVLQVGCGPLSSTRLLLVNRHMNWESRDTESTSLQPWPAHGNGNKLPTAQTLKTMLTSLLSALGK